MVDLSQLYSNPFLQIKKFKEKLNPLSFGVNSGDSAKKSNPPTADNISPKRQNVYGVTEVCRIRQKQKTLSKIEVQTVCKRYQSGDSVYKLAKDFECHRSTISAVLKRNGVEVTHLASKKPELVIFQQGNQYFSSNMTFDNISIFVCIQQVHDGFNKLSNAIKAPIQERPVCK